MGEISDIARTLERGCHTTEDTWSWPRLSRFMKQLATLGTAKQIITAESVVLGISLVSDHVMVHSWLLPW